LYAEKGQRRSLLGEGTHSMRFTRFYFAYQAIQNRFLNGKLAPPLNRFLFHFFKFHRNLSSRGFSQHKLRPKKVL